MKQLLAAAAATAILMGAGAAAGETLFERAYGYWSASLSRYEGEHYCNLKTLDVEGRALVIFANAAAQHSMLGLSDPDWRLPVGHATVVVAVGTAWRSSLQGDTAGDNFVADIMDLAFFEALGRGAAIRVEFPDGTLWQFSLEGSKPALADYRRCVAGLHKYERPSTNPFTSRD